MAGTVKTDLLAITILDADEAGAQATSPGVSVRALMDCLIKNRDDELRLATLIQTLLPSGTAKSAMATIVTDLS